MTRSLPWLVELVPDMFVEISESLAAATGITNGDRVRVFNQRGSIEAYALVTARLKPFLVDGKSIEQVGMPCTSAMRAMAKGDTANVLTSEAQSPVSNIPSTRHFSVI